jgi:hypothetical protein
MSMRPMVTALKAHPGGRLDEGLDIRSKYEEDFLGE